MILDVAKNNVKIVGDVGKTTRMTVDHSIDSHLIKLVTEYGYKDGLGSTIRESVSNGIDSHMMAGVEDPIIVKIDNKTYNNYELSIEDFGVGLDEEGFNKYIMGIGESTKRDNPFAIGGSN